MQSDRSKSGGPLGYAFVLSLLVNTACVAMVGTVAGRHPARSAPTPPRGRDASALHPEPLQMADTGRAQGQTGAGSEEGAGKAGDGQAAGEGRAGSRDGKGTRGAASQKASDSDPVTGKADSAERGRQSDGPQKAGSRASLTQAALRQEAASAGRTPRERAAREEASRETSAGKSMTAAEARRIAASSGRHQAGAEAAPSGRGGRHSGMTASTRPAVSGRNGRAAPPGDSISPKMVKYARQTLDLGTVHMTRPTHGVTGGGSADLRQVDIKVHYVVDDPRNVPKTLLPDKIVRLFPTRCNGDPGNTSKCLPTGGNIRLGGTVLHGSHDQITGVKYCVPGGGGIPSGGAARRGQGGRQAGGRIISEVYHGHGPASSGAASETSGSAKPGPLNSDETLARVIHASHLPAAHGDFRGQIPGAEAPEADRRWVSDPVAHLEAAPPGGRTTPMPRFSATVRSVGSLSQSGTVDWGRPTKARRKKAPYGGDGSGLLGMYYHGNGFGQLAFTRPDRNIDYDWSAGPPDPRIAPGTEYSVRWLGELVPKVTDTYTLMVTSDDGARLYLDGRLLVANWTTHSPTEDTATVRLEAGRRYAIKLEYYENSVPPAAIKLYWEAPSVPREYVPEQCLRYPKIRPWQ